ncbi:MAG: SGNH/GDSL hydrolase family protein [Candidatus Dormibacteraeota bacterium]|nr:SGNH/GDSL hydrolase family protein [Candidatus Dormibacteraeota bacterium]
MTGIARSSLRWRWPACIAGLLLCACGLQSSPATPPTPSQRTAFNAHVYAALGASETVGLGAEHPERDAWPQVFYSNYLPESAVFYNFGSPGATTQRALTTELSNALGVRPDLATVWLNTNDLLHSVPVDTYEQQLDQLVAALRQGGRARVLLANTPVLDGLPAYRDCLGPQAGPRCLIHDRPPPQPEAIRAAVAGYNVAIARVAARHGATLIDLHCQGDMATQHPDWLSADGFHPNTRGYAAIAGAFAGRSPCPGPRSA